jgi:hypothetical protein
MFYKDNQQNAVEGYSGHAAYLNARTHCSVALQLQTGAGQSIHARLWKGL